MESTPEPRKHRLVGEHYPQSEPRKSGESRRKALVREARKLDRITRQEEFFEFFVTNEMLGRFEDDIAEMSIDSRSEELIMSAATRMTFAQLYHALSYPRDLLHMPNNYVVATVQEALKGKISFEEVLPKMAAIAERNGFTIGFHMSKFDIRPGSKGWAVLGKEVDHRDGDLPMAYYSREFENLYRRGLTNFLYIIRAEGNNGTHRVSEDGRWWRAPTLSIVQQIPIERLRDGLKSLQDDMYAAAKEAGEPLGLGE